MGSVSQPSPVLLILAAFSRHGAALDWAKAQAEAAWSPVALESERFQFDATNYYEASMGPGILKLFYAFERLIDPANLAELKLQTNAWESDYAGLERHADERPLNLDPGYLTPAKLVLASTKDHAHRIYLSRGIYAEVTLFYKHRQWQAREWTFPDYQRADYQQFFGKCREYLRSRTSQGPAA
jgi:hypothetical protein